MTDKRNYLAVKEHGSDTVELIPNLITAEDRCDGCGVEARAVVILDLPEPPNVILLCGHHANKHEAALLIQGAHIYRKEGWDL